MLVRFVEDLADKSWGLHEKWWSPNSTQLVSISPIPSPIPCQMPMPMPCQMPMPMNHMILETIVVMCTSMISSMGPGGPCPDRYPLRATNGPTGPNLAKW